MEDFVVDRPHGESFRELCRQDRLSQRKAWREEIDGRSELRKEVADLRKRLGLLENLRPDHESIERLRSAYAEKRRELLKKDEAHRALVSTAAPQLLKRHAELARKINSIGVLLIEAKHDGLDRAQMICNNLQALAREFEELEREMVETDEVFASSVQRVRLSG